MWFRHGNVIPGWPFGHLWSRLRMRYRDTRFVSFTFSLRVRIWNVSHHSLHVLQYAVHVTSTPALASQYRRPCRKSCGLYCINTVVASMRRLAISSRRSSLPRRRYHSSCTQQRYTIYYIPIRTLQLLSSHLHAYHNIDK